MPTLNDRFAIIIIDPRTDGSLQNKTHDLNQNNFVWELFSYIFPRQKFESKMA